MNTLTITDKTYTLNSLYCNYDKERVILKIYLPQNLADNPYQYKVFDVSQMINGQHQNAVFIYMKRTLDTIPDLSGYDTDKSQCDFSFAFGNMASLSHIPEYSAFDCEAENTLVTIYHDSNINDDYQLSCAEKLFLQVAGIKNAVVTGGNFQTDLALMGDNPRKTGISLFPRKR
jgi:hypothetical protein